VVRVQEDGRPHFDIVIFALNPISSDKACATIPLYKKRKRNMNRLCVQAPPKLRPQKDPYRLGVK
jgi:hypothetical protein